MTGQISGNKVLQDTAVGLGKSGHFSGKKLMACEIGRITNGKRRGAHETRIYEEVLGSMKSGIYLLLQKEGQGGAE